MKLNQLQEAKYAQPDIIRLTGNFYTGYEGEFVEKGVTITIKRGKTTRHKYDHDLTRNLGVVKSVKGGVIATYLVTPDTTARLSKEREGWALNGFISLVHKKKYGDTWVLFDPNYNTQYDLDKISISFRRIDSFPEDIQEAKYYRAPSLEEVHDKLVKRMRNSRGDVQVLDTEIYHERQSVYADIRIWVHDKDEAERAIKTFLKKHDLTYGNIKDLSEVHHGDWRAVIVFGPWDGRFGPWDD